jgi:predicted metal-dependent hydrolase
MRTIAEKRHSTPRSPLRERVPWTFLVDDETLVVWVRESRRARAVRIVVRTGGLLEVIVPVDAPATAVVAFLEQKRQWVEARVAEARARAAQPLRLGLDRPGVVWIGGRALPVALRSGGLSTATLHAGRLVVGGSHHQAAAAVGRWYRREARHRIVELANREARRLGQEFRTISIRDPRTRWGSCSSRGTLSFSWRLLLAPDEVLGYVVAHELCHLRYPHHRRPFWELLESLWPEWQGQAAWLREYAHELHVYDPAWAVTRSV